jgi:hypothetical protein
MNWSLIILILLLIWAAMGLAVCLIISHAIGAAIYLTGSMVASVLIYRECVS